MLKQTIGGSTYMRRIKFLLALAAAMATLLAMTAAPAMAHDRDDDWNGWRGAPWWHGADWEDALGVAEIELDDCFLWHRDLFCEVDT